MVLPLVQQPLYERFIAILLGIVSFLEMKSLARHTHSIKQRFMQILTKDSHASWMVTLVDLNRAHIHDNPREILA